MILFQTIGKICQWGGRGLALLGWLLSMICPLSPAYAQNEFLSQARHLIEQQVKSEMRKKGYRCQGEIICGLKIIPVTYMQRDYMPVWFDDMGPRPIAKALVNAIRDAEKEGLNPADYHLLAIERALEEAAGHFSPDTVQAKQWADVDLILTDAFLLLGSHLSAGRINPEKIHDDWLIGPRSFGMLTALNAAITGDQLRFALDELRPSHQGYTDLVLELQKMRQVASQGGWPKLKVRRRTIRPAEINAEIAKIRRLLEATGDIQKRFNSGPLKQADHYSEPLVQAVKNFQYRHGLDPDGLIGKKTRNAMNVTVDQRIRQIELNLERWRWLPKTLGGRYILINTAAFSLKVMNGSHSDLEMKVVVGRPARQSPVFSSTMSYMVLNPYWNVPKKIAVEDILPKLVDGVDYLINQSFKVLAGWSKDAKELAPETIDWRIYDEHYFPIRLRQEPGKKNALGQIKFMFPNKFAVYLHDTPQKSLFRKFQRGFSSGCIRVEHARALANYLLSESPDWKDKTIEKYLEEGERRVVRIPNPMPIHLLYMTAWVDEEGTLQFREDIYERDNMLYDALMKRTPYPVPSSLQYVNNLPHGWMDNHSLAAEQPF